MPILGLGTATIKREKQVGAIRMALEMGYRLLDTADSYHNHERVAEGMRGFPREEVLLSSKVPPDKLGYDDVLATCERNLHELRTDYLDLYLVHGPNWEIPMEETFAGMSELVRRGWVRSIGVSNFAEQHLRQVIEVSETPISNDQVELHPLLYDWELLEFCRQRGVVVTAYGPLASGKVLDNSALLAVVAECGRTPAQVSLRWLVQKGCVVIPASGSEQHLRENMQIFDWELAPEQEARIDGIEEWVRIYCGRNWELRQERTERQAAAVKRQP